MKRLIVTIGGAPADKDAVREACLAARRAYSNEFREKKAPPSRGKHRRMSDDEREAKRLRTQLKQEMAKAEREEREHDLLMRRIMKLAEQALREEERTRNQTINVRYKHGREPNFVVICPRSLFRRNHVEAERGNKHPTRTAGDGKRNIVLKFASCRGFGDKAKGTRAYSAGEAGRIARYICRLEGIEEVEGAVVTNVIAKGAVRAGAFSIPEMQQVAGFLNALEELEKANGKSHVYQHLIFALPVELGAEGRAKALARFCAEFERLRLPFVAALHKPDPGGDQRNFHAHVVLCARPFEFRADYEWSFSAEKFTELTSKAARPYLRTLLAEAINAELREINSPLEYSGVPEAVRLGTAAGEQQKGQATIAKERALKAESKALNLVLGGLAQHHQRLTKELSDAIERFEVAHQAMPVPATHPEKSTSPPVDLTAQLSSADDGRDVSQSDSPASREQAQAEPADLSAASLSMQGPTNADSPVVQDPASPTPEGLPVSKPFKEIRLDDILAGGRRVEKSDLVAPVSTELRLPAEESLPVEHPDVNDTGIENHMPGLRSDAPQSAGDRVSDLAEEPYQLTRQEKVWQSLAVLQGQDGEDIRALIAALQREPQEIALAMYQGKLQIAYRDDALTKAAKSVANDPLTHRWLSKLAGELDFDHARVPITWHEVRVEVGKMVFPDRANLWALTHGGIRGDDTEFGYGHSPGLSR